MWTWLVLGGAAGGDTRGEEVFRDVTSASGIEFVHEVGAVGKKHLFETMVGGAAWLDADGDGLLDLYIVQGHDDVDNALRPGKQRNRLYRNRGDGTFEDVTERARVGDAHYGSGAAVGDVDNDGDTDLYVTNVGPNVLYRNDGGVFTDITAATGVECPQWSASATFTDLDADGRLDLYVANYVEYDPRVHRGCTGNRLGVPSYCHPNKFKGAPDVLYHGSSDGRFRDVSREAGIVIAGMFAGKGLGVLPTDVDRDGDVDLMVACDSVPDLLWRNLGAMRFEDAALELGTALDPDGKALAGMGVDGGDVNGDGLMDYTVTNFAKEANSLFLGDEAGFFTEASASSGIAAATFLPLGFGCKLLDYDNDGDLDVYYACGHTTAIIEQLHPNGGETYAQTDILLENDGSGRFTDVSSRSGAWFKRALVGRGAAFADYDNDGDLDAFVVNMSGPGILLRNEVGSKRAWIGLELRGDGARVNRDAYGARVTVTAASGTRRVFEVRSSGSYLCANDSRVLCGLGEERGAVRVEVAWPDGSREVFPDLSTGRYHGLSMGGGRAR